MGTPTQTSKLTFYRDYNGWCPFCERVWITLELKGIVYQERLVSLFNPPAWYKEIIPIGKVPSIIFHDEKGSLEDETVVKSSSTRRVMWESLEICKELDNLYPSTPKLVHDEKPEYQAGVELIERARKAAVAYGGVNFTTINEENLQGFLDVLDELDAFIGGTGGPFMLGSEVTGVDVQIAPWMERWKFILPTRTDKSITDGRENIKNWFDEGMHKLAPYVNRVSGDDYSFTASSNYFLNLKASKEENEEVSSESAKAIEAANEIAESKLELFREKQTHVLATGLSVNEEEFARRAASKIISNHKYIVEDCTNVKPESQTDLTRAKSEEAADIGLRAVVSSLFNISQSDDIICPIFDDENDSEDGSQALNTIARRLCVPRDMGAPSAATLRRILLVTADSISN